MAYVAPHLRARLAAQQPTSPDQIERTKWDELGRSIKRVINKTNRQNFQDICTSDLFQPNLIRGRGILCRDVIQACLDEQSIAGATDMTPIYAALIAVINSQLPNVGYIFTARVLERYDRRLRIDVDKFNAKKALELLCWLANFYVLDFVNILEIIRVLFPSSVSQFASLLTSPDTMNDPKTNTLAQMCELSITAFQLCAQLIKSENQAIYRSLLDQYRELLHEIDNNMFDYNDDDDNNKNGKNNFSHNTRTTTTRNTRQPHDSQYTRLRFALERLTVYSNDDFRLFPQFGDEIHPTHDENNKPIPPPAEIEDLSLNLVPTDVQFTHQFDNIADSKLLGSLCDKNADWYKADPQYDLNERRWGYIRDIIMGVRDPIPEDLSVLDNDEDFIAIDINSLDEQSPYAAAFSVHKLSDSLQLRQENNNDDVNEFASKTFGFGGSSDITKVAIDPEVEAVQIRKSLYLIFQQSATAEEAVHRILKTLRQQYSTTKENIAKYTRFVALTLHDTMLARGVYQKDDGAIAHMLCTKRRDFAIEFEDLFAVTVADIVNKKERETQILAQFFGDLLSQEAIDYTVFQYLTLDVSKESLIDPVAISIRVFLTALLKQIKKNITEKKLLQILTFKDYYIYTRTLFEFDNMKKYIAAVHFYNYAGLQLFKDEVEFNQNQFMELHKQMQQNNSSSSSDDSDTSSDSDTSDSDSSDSDGYRYNRRRSPSPSHRRHYSDDSDDSRSRSPPPRRRYNDDSRSPPPPRRRYNDDSRSPPPPSSRHNRSRSRSPPYHSSSRHNNRRYSSDSDDSDSDRQPSRTHTRKYNGSDSDSDYNRSRSRYNDRSRSRSPPRRRYDDDNNDSRSPPRRYNNDSRSPPRRRYNDDSRSPPPRRRYNDDSRSPPPPPPRHRSRHRSNSPSPPPPRDNNDKQNDLYKNLVQDIQHNKDDDDNLPILESNNNNTSNINNDFKNDNENDDSRNDSHLAPAGPQKRPRQGHNNDGGDRSDNDDEFQSRPRYNGNK